MKEYNFKASDSNGEILMGLGFPFSFVSYVNFKNDYIL